MQLNAGYSNYYKQSPKQNVAFGSARASTSANTAPTTTSSEMYDPQAILKKLPSMSRDDIFSIPGMEIPPALSERSTTPQLRQSARTALVAMIDHLKTQNARPTLSLRSIDLIKSTSVPGKIGELIHSELFQAQFKKADLPTLAGLLENAKRNQRTLEEQSESERRSIQEIKEIEVPALRQLGQIMQIQHAAILDHQVLLQHITTGYEESIRSQNKDISAITQLVSDIASRKIEIEKAEQEKKAKAEAELAEKQARSDAAKDSLLADLADEEKANAAKLKQSAKPSSKRKARGKTSKVKVFASPTEVSSSANTKVASSTTSLTSSMSKLSTSATLTPAEIHEQEGDPSEWKTVSSRTQNPFNAQSTESSVLSKKQKKELAQANKDRIANSKAPYTESQWADILYQLGEL